jgi:hypothetical protein
VAYVGKRANRQRVVVVDGVEGSEYDFLLAGSRLVFDGPRQLHTLAKRGDEFLRVEITLVTGAAGTAAPH